MHGLEWVQLATPILRALEGTDKQWLSDLLHAFNKGGIDQFNEIVGANSAQFNAQVQFVALRIALIVWGSDVSMVECCSRLWSASRTT